jgi:hypothetical protein
MYFEPSSELVEAHHRRLHQAAQDPPPRVALWLWAKLRRRRTPAPVVTLPARDVERLAA